MTRRPSPTLSPAPCEKPAGDLEHAHHVFRLYVAGTTRNCERAIVNIRRIFEDKLPGRYVLDIVDISQHPALAVCEQIIAAPTLIRRFPLPQRRFIGDLSQTERILQGLDLRAPARRADT